VDTGAVPAFLFAHPEMVSSHGRRDFSNREVGTGFNVSLSPHIRVFPTESQVFTVLHFW